MHLFHTASSGTTRRRRRVLETAHGCTTPAVAAVAPRPSSRRAVGGGIELRSLTPADGHHVSRLLERLSPNSRYRRYFRLLGSLAPAEVARFVAVSRDHRAIGAFDDDELVGMAQYFRSADRADVAEVAVEVADSHHRRGLGARLVRRLARSAVDDGITHFTATVLADNRPVLELMRHSGWKITTTPEGPYADVVVTLPEPCRAGGARSTTGGERPSLLGRP
ncbi:MAG: GNAT family N-acetyltransferase [Ornithinibacter sp.]